MSKNHTHHWISQRVSAGVLVILGLWFVCALLGHKTSSYHEIRAWIQQPVTFVLLSLYLGGMVYHGLLGVRVVAEDYISCPFRRAMVIWAAYGVFVPLGIYGWIQLLTLYIQGLTQTS